MHLRCMDPSVHLSVEVLQTVVEVTKPLSVKCQGVFQDILRTTESVQDCVNVLQHIRSGDMFDILFVQAEEVHDRPTQMPRITNRHRHRPNLPADSVLVYNTRVSFNPSLDTSTSTKALLLGALTPTLCLERDTYPQLRKR